MPAISRHKLQTLRSDLLCDPIAITVKSLDIRRKLYLSISPTYRILVREDQAG